MEEVFGNVINEISGTVPHSEKEYMGEDGLLHCLICHRNVQTEVEFMGKKKIVRCICDCKRKEIDAFNEKEKQINIDRKRNVCFMEAKMKDWTFQNDDRKNAEISDAIKNYAEKFEDFKKDGTGLLLYGTVGTGKTYYAACIANYLLDKNIDVLMTNFSILTNEISGMKDGKQKYIDSLNKYKLLIIDDLGIERNTEYMQEMVFNIIDCRYRSGLPFIITTNLTAAELKKTSDIGYSRIYDRILERCFPVAVTGESRRRQEVKDSYFDIKEKLGL